jgi:group I intron endonuclease
MIRRRFWSSPDHPPLAHAGIYSITHIATGRRYIGLSKDIHFRLRRHETGHSDSPLIAAAIAEHGPAAFIAEAMYYSLTGAAHLSDVEAMLIERFDTVASGFNIQARSGAGGARGEAFKHRIREGKNRPDVRAKMLHNAADPEQRARRGAAIREAFDDPEVRERHRRAVAAVQRDPAHKARMRVLYDSPEYRAKLRAIRAVDREAKSARMLAWHADPEAKTKHRAAIQASCTPERNAAIAASRRGKVWITNGETNRLQTPETEIPAGWWRGHCTNVSK